MRDEPMPDRCISLDVAGSSWAERLQRQGLPWVGAFDADDLVGFVHLCWDGGAPAFVLDTTVHPEHRRRGIRTR